MARTRICVQIDFQGKTPLVINSNGTSDKRLSLINLARLLRGVDKGAQYRKPSTPTTVVVQGSVVQASATATCAAVAAADTVTIGGTALTATQGRASGTLTAAGTTANDTCVINGSTFTAVSGTAGAQQFDVSSGNNTTIATNLAAAINASVDPKVKGLIEAKSSAAVVTVYAKATGTSGNSFTLVGTAVRLAASGANLANGAALTNNQFDYIGTDNETAADLTRAINASTSANIKQTSATVASNVVTVTAKTPGVAGNAITFVSSTGVRLAVTGSGFLASGSAGAPTQWTF